MIEYSAHGGQQRASDPVELELTGGYDLPGVGAWNPGLSEEQQGVLTAKPLSVL